MKTHCSTQKQRLVGSASVNRLRPTIVTLRCASSRSWKRQATTCSSGGGGGSGGAGGVLVLPGFFQSSRQYMSLVADLRAKGFDTEVVPIATSDWLPVLYGSSFEWYLQRLDSVLRDMHSRHGRVALVGHSAGGWLARILLGEEPYQGVQYGRSKWVHTLLTLGTPHQSIENYPLGRAEESLKGANLDLAPPGVRGSSLQFANHFYPDAASLGDVRMVCACGDAIRGRPLWGSGSTGGDSSSSTDSYSSSSDAAGSSYSFSNGKNLHTGGIGRQAGSRWDAYMAHEGYKSGCGRGDVDGDGVTPICISQVPGAEQLILPGVWHIPRGRGSGQLWYGDAQVQDQWLQYLREPQASLPGRP